MMQTARKKEISPVMEIVRANDTQKEAAQA